MCTIAVTDVVVVVTTHPLLPAIPPSRLPIAALWPGPKPTASPALGNQDYSDAQSDDPTIAYDDSVATDDEDSVATDDEDNDHENEDIITSPRKRLRLDHDCDGMSWSRRSMLMDIGHRLQRFQQALKLLRAG